jgi:competence protein ComEC
VLVLSACAWVTPALAPWLAAVISAPTGWMLDALRLMASWPGGAIVLAQPDHVSLALAVLSVAMLLAPRPIPARAVWMIGLLPLLVRGPEPVPSNGFRLSAIDVGQGMAVLIEAGGKRLLYDTGPAWDAGADAGGRLIIPWLRSRGISSLDAVVISHADIDHSGGAATVLRLAGSQRIYSSIPEGHRLLAALPHHEACRRGYSWRWGQVSFEFLHPGPEFPPGAARSPTNAISCVLKIESPAGSALLAGDIEARQEIDLVERLGSRLKSDLLLVPHHGSNTSSTARFIQAVSPSVAIFQVGYRNRFRHPTDKVLARYEGAGVRVLRTDQHGAISIVAGGNNVAPSIHLGRQQPARYWRVRTDAEGADTP